MTWSDEVTTAKKKCRTNTFEQFATSTFLSFNSIATTQRLFLGCGHPDTSVIKRVLSAAEKECVKRDKKILTWTGRHL